VERKAAFFERIWRKEQELGNDNGTWGTLEFLAGVATAANTGG
jgi:hypothetical protein